MGMVFVQQIYEWVRVFGLSDLKKKNWQSPRLTSSPIYSYNLPEY